MNKTNKILTIVIMILLVLSLAGNFYLMMNQEIVKQLKITSSTEEYDAKYLNFDTLDKKTQLSIFNGALDAGTSPTEIKYLMLKISPNLSDTEKDDAIAKYINHIQYFASTYTNIALMYDNILKTLSSSIDFSSRDAAFQVSDKVLRNLLLEVWDSDMFLYLSKDANTGPSIIVDYDGLLNNYKDMITSVTKDYLTLKTEIVNGKISNEDGSVNYDNLKVFMTKTNAFISQHPDFAIIEDVKYMYVVAGKMFLNVYMLEGTEVEYTAEDIERITVFQKDFSNTPAGDIAKMILDDVSLNGKLTEDVFTQVQGAFSALAE